MDQQIRLRQQLLRWLRRKARILQERLDNLLISADRTYQQVVFAAQQAIDVNTLVQLLSRLLDGEEEPNIEAMRHDLEHWIYIWASEGD